MPKHESRRWAWRALLALVSLVGVITFWPTPVDRPMHGALSVLLGRLHEAGLPQWIGYSVVESAANVLMFVPLGALVAVIAVPSLWWSSGVLGLLASLVIEFGQMLLLPQRFASPIDLATNTAGALLGGGIVAIVRLLRARRAAD
jgi:glycopeptide antibiotics resistance protein